MNMKIRVLIGLLYLLKLMKLEHIPIEINKFINNDTTKSSSLERIESNIFRIQAYDSIMCGYFCIEFINYMLKGKNLLDYTNLLLLMTLKIMDELLKEYLKMNNIIELTDKAEPSSSERTANKYKLDEINKIRDYFDNEIKERKI